MSSVKAGVLAAVATVLIGSLALGVGYAVVNQSGVLAYFNKPKYVPPPIKVEPVVEEKSESAAQPLLHIWEESSKQDKVYTPNLDNALLSRLRRRKFEDLETFANHLRGEKVRFIGGQWALSRFYAALDTPSEGADSGDSKWNAHLALVGEWEKAYPESITPRIVHAETLTTWAWHARTDKYARDVSDEQWKLFNERLSAAVDVLEASKDLEPMDPQYFATLLSIALGQGWHRSDFMEAFDAGLEFEPTYAPLHTGLAMRLLPQWGGAKGEWSDTLASVATRQGTDEAYAVYHRTFSHLVFHYFKYGDVAGEIKKHWPELKRGYQAREKLYGLAEFETNDMSRMAYIAGDREQFRAAFARVGNTARLDLWDNDTELLAKAKAWAEEK